ncbi:hypothetical protein [Aestuariivirga sp.]|uniref:hypothetical protein n=1 Tax=Aestuariivirga sp. TaxID=2650926 RepID=UPI003BAD1304
MSILRLFWVAMGLFLLSACAPKTTSICGGTGACCAIGAYDAAGKPDYTVYQCVAPDACGSECRNKYDGLTSCPYKDAPEGSCGVVKKTVWIWDGDFWNSTTSINSNAQLSMLQKQADNEFNKMGVSGVGRCQAACKAGSGTFCPSAIVPNSVSLGLLTTMAAIAGSGDLSDRTIPISTIEKNFGVSNALGSCPRGDILVRSGKILNSGSECVAGVNPLKEDKKVDADLTTDPVVIADIAANPGFLTFSEERKGFMLSMVDKGVNDLFGGSLSYAATARETTVAVTLKRPEGQEQPCIGVEGIATASSSFHETARLLSANPEILSSAVRDAKSIIGKLSPESKAPSDDDADEIEPRLLPMTAEYERILNGPDSAEKTSLRNTMYDVAIEGVNYGISLPQALLFVDLDICQKSIGTISDQDLPKLIPVLDPIVGLSSGEMDKRERLAGEILLCRYGYNSLPKVLRLGMHTAAETASTK